MTLFPAQDMSRYPPATAFYRPERLVKPPGMVDKAVAAVTGGLHARLKAWTGGGRSIVTLTGTFADRIAAMDADGIKTFTADLRCDLAARGMKKDLVARAFALIRELAERTVGLRHFDVQLQGAWVMLRGMVAEMNTGEGKTLTATLAAGTAALAGLPVHVISVNDYLTERDADWMGPVYRALGLSVGCVTEEMPPAARRDAYRCDITYATNKVMVFDYLRDRMALKEKDTPLIRMADTLCGDHCGKGDRSRCLLQRGLSFAIVDEADSVLIDEARTPLIISGPGIGGAEEAFLRQALDLAQRMAEGADYRKDEAKRHVTLTETGKALLRKETEPLGPEWRSAILREEVVEKALTAMHFFRRDEHYLVVDGKIQIVDEFTGRVMPDRSWERGLHQLIEIREDCPVTPQRDTLARISYQRFFRRYLRLGGMTGTAREVRKEMWRVYGLAVVRVPTHRPVIRRYGKIRVYRTADEKWAAVVQRIRDLHDAGRPVLIGTRSVAASEHLSALLTASGSIPHRVLNAYKIKEEAVIVAEAGMAGAVTVATNMAGRGTDIKLGEGVREKGGLHVMLTERHEAARVDRQLAGRCARQGDPGSFEAFLSMEDPILNHGGGWLRRPALIWARLRLPGWSWLGRIALYRAQKNMERKHARMRRQLLKMDENIQTMLSFSGRSE